MSNAIVYNFIQDCENLISSGEVDIKVENFIKDTTPDNYVLCQEHPATLDGYPQMQEHIPIQITVCHNQYQKCESVSRNIYEHYRVLFLYDLPAPIGLAGGDTIRVAKIYADNQPIYAGKNSSGIHCFNFNITIWKIV